MAAVELCRRPSSAPCGQDQRNRARGAAAPSRMKFERTQGEFTVSTDPARVNLGLVHSFLTECYWAKGITREVVSRSIQNSLVFGVYRGAKQVGFARVITDHATFAYIGDVFIL